MLSEVEIKALVLQEFLRQGRILANSLVFNEMNLAGKVRRLDLAYVTNNEMVAIEIKSERDSLFRLPGQLDEYSKYFDRIVVVAASKFVSQIISMVDSSVEIFEVSQEGLKVCRRGKKVASVKKESYVELMTKREVLILAKMVGIRTSDLPMYELKVEVLDRIGKLSKEKVKAVLLHGFEKRFSLSSNRFFKKVLECQRVVSEDVALLSPYAPMRVG
ncbi:TPA: sce7726 family protein [Pseudomonas aeruginosa]|uniref:sce7726 family protein n=1 Tax=Pseudomonas aeruginosa TaxID=287 RepID=UPI000E323212|nr:sce7726 family protein [Pseudomonas aeruginosa]EKY0776382.1 sce7726 family protein [Pseudomonas aeruginosa]ELO1026043.1 sce7726 family protein [Pseudomonas aeruginosa]MBG4188297.1 sce7726 family protein [Pseudomonas aeruginosa]MBI8716603.1 sce7726 family protein [Pseudomonas aeruginosa]MCO3718723.1 sce7726 family protein [Pseudomonas aeruginosa]